VSTQHAIVGSPDQEPIRDEDWAAWSAGFEAGLREGIATTRLQISVELVPVGPANAGLKLWRAITAARLQQRSTYSEPGLSAQQLRERARLSWGLPRDGENGGRGR
jgi:hypothetical protein